MFKESSLYGPVIDFIMAVKIYSPSPSELSLLLVHEIAICYFTRLFRCAQNHFVHIFGKQKRRDIQWSLYFTTLYFKTTLTIRPPILDPKFKFV